MKYNVESYITNTSGQYVAKVEATYNDNLEGAAVKYHQLLAAYHNAPDVLLAVAKIVDEFGNPMGNFREEVDHRPKPEPTPDAPEDSEGE